MIASPITDTDLPEPTFSAVGWHPAEFWAINRFGNQDRSTLLGGQFNTNGLTERLYDAMVLETFYTIDTSDVQAPIIWGVMSEVGEGNEVTFAVEVTDTLRVLVTYDVPAIPPKLEQTFTLDAAEHAKFERFLFGFTTAVASGDTRESIVRFFELSFIRPTDPVITSDPNLSP